MLHFYFGNISLSTAFLEGVPIGKKGRRPPLSLRRKGAFAHACAPTRSCASLAHVLRLSPAGRLTPSSLSPLGTACSRSVFARLSTVHRDGGRVGVLQGQEHPRSYGSSEYPACQDARGRVRGRYRVFRRAHRQKVRWRASESDPSFLVRGKNILESRSPGEPLVKGSA